MVLLPVIFIQAGPLGILQGITVFAGIQQLVKKVQELFHKIDLGIIQG
jgi:hypothetical protein